MCTRPGVFSVKLYTLKMCVICSHKAVVSTRGCAECRQVETKALTRRRHTEWIVEPYRAQLFSISFSFFFFLSNVGDVGLLEWFYFGSRFMACPRVYVPLMRLRQSTLLTDDGHSVMLFLFVSGVREASALSFCRCLELMYIAGLTVYLGRGGERGPRSHVRYSSG